MTTQTLQSAPLTAASSPRVNLMPPEIAEAARFRQIQVMLGAAVLGAVVVVGLLYVNAHSGVSSAKTELTQAQTENTSLQTKLGELASVQQTLNEVQTKQALLSTAMGTEVKWSKMLTDLAFRVPSNVWLTGMSVAQDTTALPAAAASTATLGAAPVVTGPIPIGTIKFEGYGFSHDDVAKWLDGMAKVPGYSEPVFTQSNETAIGTKGVVSFQGGVTLLDSLFSLRYVTGGSATGTTPTTTTPTTGSTGTTELPGGTVPGTGIAAP